MCAKCAGWLLHWEIVIANLSRGNKIVYEGNLAFPGKDINYGRKDR